MTRHGAAALVLWYVIALAYPLVCPAQDAEVVALRAGDPAPFDGVLFRPAAARAAWTRLAELRASRAERDLLRVEVIEERRKTAAWQTVADHAEVAVSDMERRLLIGAGIGVLAWVLGVHPVLGAIAGGLVPRL